MNCFVQLYYEKINYKYKNDSPAKFHYLLLPPISLSLTMVAENQNRKVKLKLSIFLSNWLADKFVLLNSDVLHM